MGLCLSICDIGVIMMGEGLGGWEGIRRWPQMVADERRVAKGAGDWGFHTSHFILSHGTQRYSNHFDFLCEM